MSFLSKLFGKKANELGNAASAKFDISNVEPLIRAMEHARWPSQEKDEIVETLAEIGEPAVEPLIAALKDGGFSAQMTIVEALGEIGNTRAVDALIATLKDNDSEVRWLAALKLGNIGDTRAVEPLIAALKEEEHWNPRKAAAIALGNIGDTRAVEALTAALKDDNDSVVVTAAKEALDKLSRKG